MAREVGDVHAQLGQMGQLGLAERQLHPVHAEALKYVHEPTPEGHPQRGVGQVDAQGERRRDAVRRVARATHQERGLEYESPDRVDDAPQGFGRSLTRDRPRSRSTGDEQERCQGQRERGHAASASACRSSSLVDASPRGASGGVRGIALSLCE